MIPIVTAPVRILMVLGICRPLGISLDILSIGGWALAAGTLVDASILVVEQVHKSWSGKPRAASSRPFARHCTR